MEDVVIFPKENNRLPDLLILREGMERVKTDPAYKKLMALNAVDAFSTILMDHLNTVGIDITNDRDIKDLALALESIKSYIFKYYGSYHPLQNIADDLFIKREDNVILLKLTTLNKMISEKPDDTP